MVSIYMYSESRLLELIIIATYYAIIIANRRERALVHGQSNKWREEGSYRRSRR